MAHVRVHKTRAPVAVPGAVVAESPTGKQPAAAAPERPYVEDTVTTIRIRGADTKAARLRVGDRTIVTTDGLTILEEMDLSEALKVNQLSNPVFIEWATHAACVREIDGDPVPFPSSEGQVKAIIRRVGDDLMRFMLLRKSARQQTAVAEIERAKKSMGTADSETLAG
jgi:hypothetical protein